MKKKSVHNTYKVENIVPNLTEEERKRRELAIAKVMIPICRKYEAN